MGEVKPTTKIRIVIADLTIANGETSGSVEMSVTENGRTETVRRQIGKPARKRPAKRKDGGSHGA